MKKMLCVRIEKRGDASYLVFESEDYYRRPTRRVAMECFYSDFSPEALLKNVDLYESTIESILLCLFSSEDHYKQHALLYPHHRNKKQLLRIDVEEPLFKPKRDFCTELERPSYDFISLVHDFGFKSKIARIILKHLPMKDFFQETPIVELDFDEAMRKYGSANIWDHRKPLITRGLE
jgi:hypothetical protein